MLVLDPQKRITIEEVIHHVWEMAWFKNSHIFKI
ncbi:uncharacterized protein [Blastocystis hominis]|uniref:Uncharacterized protein n=1 Tax=Blastocystis hominis TaxID=12968 RepID=D8MB23_BLAHO|nr:uncharacterized protein [Blastocystis hominis]CBK25262.2 unnamed protein product [Blastocystis hominis]|eukprot:XP_012899310.1 uncharacterized protein [Blastocystis hominis]